MTDDTGATILREVLALGPRLGKLEERCQGMERHLRSIDTRLETGATHMHEQGTAIAMHAGQLERHERSLSNLYRRVDVTEDTGVHHLVEERTRWNTLRWIAVILVGLLGVLATVSQLTRCNTRSSLAGAPDAGAPSARR